MTSHIPSHSLEQVRSHLLARRAELKDRIRSVAADLSRSHEPLAADAADRAIQTHNDEALQVIETSAVSELETLDEALERLQAGRYGVCKVCDSRIEPDRLRAVPHAVTCAGCAGD